MSLYVYVLFRKDRWFDKSVKGYLRKTFDT